MTRIIFCLFCCFAGLAACTSGEREVVLLHTNDSHGGIFPFDSLGGMAERAALIRRVRDSFPGEVLLLDAGDFNTGQAVSNFFKARPDLLAYNYMGYDAATFGNHEFDQPTDTLLMQMRLADFPFVVSNVTYQGLPLGKPVLVREVNGIRVGLFGIVTTGTARRSIFGREVAFAPEEEAARRAVEDLRREGVDLVVGLVHLGLAETFPGALTSPQLAERVPGIDVLVDGHTHSYIEEPLRVGRTWIITASHSGRYVGRGRLFFRGTRFTGMDWHPLPVRRGVEPDTALSRLLCPYVDALDRVLHSGIGVAEGDYPVEDRGVNLVRSGENALGNLVADALKWQADSLFPQVDFALINSGAIRAGLRAGTVTAGDLLAVLPFDNSLEVVAMRGKDLLRLFAFYAALAPGSGAFPQVSREVQAVFDRHAGTLERLLLRGQPVDTARIYHFATCDYVASGMEFAGTGLDTCMARHPSPVKIAEALAAYVREQGRVRPATSGRLLLQGEGVHQ